LRTDDTANEAVPTACRSPKKIVDAEAPQVVVASCWTEAVEVVVAAPARVLLDLCRTVAFADTTAAPEIVASPGLTAIAVAKTEEDPDRLVIALWVTAHADVMVALPAHVVVTECWTDATPITLANPVMGATPAQRTCATPASETVTISETFWV
jgi:hypothetical protein